MTISSGLRFPSLSQTLITGAYRSGTEFVTHCIDSHPQLSATMYRVNALRFIRGRYEPLARPENLKKAVRDLAERLSSRYQVSLNEKDVLGALAGTEELTSCALYDTAMSSLYLTETTRHWAEKSQLLWRDIPHFLERMPNGRAIMIIRDPRAVVASFKKFTYCPSPAYLGAVFNSLDALQCAHAFARRYPETFLCIRYEDAALDPLAAARAAWRLLKLDDTHELTPQQTWKDAYGQPWLSNSSFQKTNGNDFNLTASLDRGKMLSPAERDLTEGVCGHAMRLMGYAVEKRTPNWQAALKLFHADPEIRGYFVRWLRTGQGVQAFPSDPLKPENWRKRGKEALCER